MAAKKKASKKTASKKKTAKKKAAKKAAPAKKKTAKKAAGNKKAKKAASVSKKKTAAKQSKKVKAKRRPRTEVQPFTPYRETRGEEYMNPEQVEHFRKILTDWKRLLMEEVDRTVHHMQDEASNFPDPNDRATQEEEFALELRTRDREQLEAANQNLKSDQRELELFLINQ